MPLHKKTFIALALLGTALLVSAGFSALLQRPSTTDSQKPSVDAADASYLIEGNEIRLAGGTNETAKTTTRIFDASAHGDINGDGIEDTGVVLIQETGGSGSFFYVSALLKAADGSQRQPMNAILVGDRIAPQNTSIRNGALLFAYADRYPWEPFTARPSVGKSKTVLFEQGGLKERPTPVLDDMTARKLAIASWGDCPGTTKCRELIVSTLDGKDGVWYVQAILDGLPDDSVRAHRFIKAAHSVDDGWVLGAELLSDRRCRAGRGHDDFSVVPCK